jgi:hypothetical protein
VGQTGRQQHALPFRQRQVAQVRLKGDAATWALGQMVGLLMYLAWLMVWHFKIFRRRDGGK